MKILAVILAAVLRVVRTVTIRSLRQAASPGNLRLSHTARHTPADARGHAGSKTSDVCGEVMVRRTFPDNSVHEYGLISRSAPVRVVDFIQFGNIHELPILRLRLEEMGDFVDEIHIAEGDRDFSGNSKQFVMQKLLIEDPVIARWSGKIKHHAVHVPGYLSGYDIQKYVIATKHEVGGAGIMLEGDLDEVISRTVLLSLRHCKPVGPIITDWNGEVKMAAYYYNMGWSGPGPSDTSIVHSYGGNSTVLASHVNDTFTAGNKSKYIYSRDDSIICLSGQAGWHLSWMLDGAEGIAHKIMRGRVESMPSWAAPHANSEEHLANFLHYVFLPNPDMYDKQVQRTHLSARDLPEVMLEDPEKYKALLGEAYHVATASRKSSADVQPVSFQSHMVSMPCSCQSSSKAWKRTARSQPKCIFIDLGAADGNSFATFLSGSFGKVSSCPSDGSYEAYLVEANPLFEDPLTDLAKEKVGKVHVLAPKAAYMCSGQTSFYIDTVNGARNYWGSSMSTHHPDVQKSGHVSVTVRTLNVIQLLAEHAIPEDFVTVKMDIEGAEWDILPCLANSPHAALIDQLLVEMHHYSLGLAGTTEAEMQAVFAKLKKSGVSVPSYNSGTL